MFDQWKKTQGDPNERVRTSTGGDKLIHNLSNTLTSRKGSLEIKGKRD